MSQHAMNIGCYTINLGTEQGQRIHRYSPSVEENSDNVKPLSHLSFTRYHLILLPLLPIIILLIQNYSTYNSNAQVIQDLSDVSDQVRNSLDFAELTKKLQQERVSVALKFFIKDNESNIYAFSSLKKGEN